MEQANLNISYAVRQQSVTGLAVSYAIGAVEASVSSLTVAYAIAQSNNATVMDEFAGTWADNTQAAANMLPDWHAGRKGGPGSNYQQFLNSAAQGIDDLQNKMHRGRRNLHLYTAETKEVSEVYLAPVSQPAKQNPSQNLLLNSDFTDKKPAIIDQPMHWSSAGTTGTITYAEDSLFGGSAVELRAAAGSRCRLSQSVDLSSTPGQSLTFSAWIKTPLAASVASGESASTDVAHIQLSALRMDGTPLSTQVALPVTTSGSWQRVSATVKATSEIYSASCKIEVGATDTTRTHLTYVGGMQLEVGEVSTSWQQGDNDSPDAPYGVVAFGSESTAQETIGGQATTWTQTPGQRVHFISNEAEFLSTFIPTSITSVVSTATQSPSLAETAKGFYYEWTDKRPFTTSYEIDSSDSSVINRNLRETGEVYQAFKLAEKGIVSSSEFVNADSFFEDNGSYTQEIRAICLLEGNLLALVKDSYTPTGGTLSEAWSIKVIGLNQHPGTDFLQVVADLKIPADAQFSFIESQSGAFNYMGVATGDPKTLVLATSGSTPAYFNITVAYDYYTADLNRGQLVTRENYAGNLVIT